MRRSRSTAIAATAVVGLAALSGCSAAAAGQAAGGAKTAVLSVADELNLAASKTAGYDSVKMNMAISSSATGLITMGGQVGWNPVALDMTMSSPSLAKLGSGSMQMMMSGTTMYMGTQNTAAFKGKHWLKMDLSALGAQGQQLSQLMTQSNNQSPALQLKLLTSAEGVSEVGTGNIDGVECTHYSGTVDVQTLAAKMTAADPALKGLLSSASAQGITTETVDLWVSAQNLPIRDTTSAVTANGTVNATINYSDYSATPFTITPPAASDTLDYSQLTAGS
jgi:hypothetical protein